MDGMECLLHRLLDANSFDRIVGSVARVNGTPKHVNNIQRCGLESGRSSAQLHPGSTPHNVIVVPCSKFSTELR
jgi:hypothetical protein